MFYKILGWCGVILAIFSLLPSLVPGALSMIGFFISLIALFISILSTKAGNVFYLKAASFIVAIGMLFINDSLRIVGSLEHISWPSKLFIYGVYLFIIFFAWRYAKKKPLTLA